MFRGQSQLKFDSKGRMSVPARFRESINVHYGGNLVISQGFFSEYPHLLLVPLRVWEGFESRFGGEDLFDATLDAFQARLLTMGGCSEVRIDEHGRILVPTLYREHAEIGSEVTCVGMGRYLTLWKPGTLAEAMTRGEEDLDRVRKHLVTTKTDREVGPDTGP